MSETYTVEKILAKRMNNGKIEYLIKWEGYSIKETTWEPMKNLKNVAEMIDEYEVKIHKMNEKCKIKLNLFCFFFNFLFVYFN